MRNFSLKIQQSRTRFRLNCLFNVEIDEPVVMWQGLETKEPSYFITKENQERLARAQEKSLVQVFVLRLET